METKCFSCYSSQTSTVTHLQIALLCLFSLHGKKAQQFPKLLVKYKIVKIFFFSQLGELFVACLKKLQQHTRNRHKQLLYQSCSANIVPVFIVTWYQYYLGRTGHTHTIHIVLISWTTLAY